MVAESTFLETDEKLSNYTLERCYKCLALLLHLRLIVDERCGKVVRRYIRLVCQRWLIPRVIIVIV